MQRCKLAGITGALLDQDVEDDGAPAEGAERGGVGAFVREAVGEHRQATETELPGGAPAQQCVNIRSALGRHDVHVDAFGQPDIDS
jgi:hypothetical protein